MSPGVGVGVEEKKLQAAAQAGGRTGRARPLGGAVVHPGVGGEAVSREHRANLG